MKQILHRDYFETGHIIISMSQNEILLFASWFCPYVQRVWIALEYKRLKYRYIEINPYAENDGVYILLDHPRKK